MMSVYAYNAHVAEMVASFPPHRFPYKPGGPARLLSR